MIARCTIVSVHTTLFLSTTCLLCVVCCATATGSSRGDSNVFMDDAQRRIALLLEQSKFEEERAKEMEEIVYRSLAVSVAAQHQLAKRLAGEPSLSRTPVALPRPR